MQDIPIGYTDEGRAIRIPLTHTVVSAVTGLGKTEAVRTMIKGAVGCGAQVLAIDVKAKPRDFAGLGPEVKPFIIESTEPLAMLRLLEKVAGTGLFSYYNTLLDACSDTKTHADVLRALIELRDNKKAHPRRREQAKTLASLLETLREQREEGDYDTDLRLPSSGQGVFVMNVSGLAEGVQQLVVDSVFRRLSDPKAPWRRVVVVLEEAINFIAQGEKQQFETSGRRYIRMGRSAELYLWAVGQSLTEMDVRIRKQMRVWLLGAQSEENEAEKFRRQIPMKGVTAHDIMHLTTGWFLATIRTEDAVTTQKVYVQPTWLPDAVAEAVAAGLTPVSSVQSYKRKQKEMRDLDAEERQKYEREIEAWRKRAQEVDRQAEQEVARTKKMVEDLSRALEAEREKSKAFGERHNEAMDQVRALRKQLGEQNLKGESPEETGRAVRAAGVNLGPPVPVADLRELVHDEVARAVEKLGIPVREVPPPRAILQGLLAEAVDRIKEKVAAVNVDQKKMLAYLAAKGTAIKYAEVVKVVQGYDSGPGRTLLKALAETGLVRLDSNNSRVRYIGQEVVGSGLRAQYDLTEEDVQKVVAAIENEFAHMITEST